MKKVKCAFGGGVSETCDARLWDSTQITREKSKSSVVVKHQRIFVIQEATSNVKELFKSSATTL